MQGRNSCRWNYLVRSRSRVRVGTSTSGLDSMASPRRWLPGLGLEVVCSFILLIVLHSGQGVAAAVLSRDENVMMNIREELYATPENRLLLDQQYNTTLSPCKWPGVVCRNSSVVAVFMRTKSITMELKGPLPASLGSLRNLTRLSLPGIGFSGPIPGGIFNASQLELLDLSNNSFTGPIPASIAKLQKLSLLNLGKNHLSGTLQPLAGLEAAKDLSSIDLQNNQITGNLSALQNLTSLVLLNLNSNKITGDLSFLRNLKKLQSLELRENQLSEGLAALEDLQIAKDQGLAPSQLLYVDLGSNQLTGGVPELFFLDDSRLYTLVLGDNNLNGSLQPAKVSSLLENLQLNNNEFTGLFSVDLLSIAFLKILRINNNSLIGDLSRLPDNSAIVELDLSYNKFSGSIPDSLFRMDQLTYADLSHNNFSGPLPENADNFNGNPDTIKLGANPGLCSLVGTYGLPDCTAVNAPASSPPAPSRGTVSPGCQPAEDTGGSGVPLRTVALWVGLSSILVLLLGSIVGVCVRYKYKKRTPPTKQHPGFPLITAVQDGGNSIRLRTMKELREATNNFSSSNQIGMGGFGIVYRGILDGEVVAIKKSERYQSEEAKRQVLNEITVMAQVHHRNLVGLLGCCLTTNAAILVLEYVPQGSLADLLQGPRRAKLTWAQRLKIALQVAEALNYLHTAAYPPIFHQDVKSANILLDNNFDAKVADFGVSRLVPKDVSHVTAHNIQGTLAYMDPDVHVSHHLTAKSDVFSFGVVLLEILTARPAGDLDFRGPGLARLSASLTDADTLFGSLDPMLQEEPGLRFQEDFKGTALSVAEVALRCLQPSPAHRPFMREIVTTLSVLNGLSVSVDSGHTKSKSSRSDYGRPEGEGLTEEYLRALNRPKSLGPQYGYSSYTPSSSGSAAFSSSHSRRIDSDNQAGIPSTTTNSSVESAPESASKSHYVPQLYLKPHLTPESSSKPLSTPESSWKPHSESAVLSRAMPSMGHQTGYSCYKRSSSESAAFFSSRKLESDYQAEIHSTTSSTLESLPESSSMPHSAPKCSSKPHAAVLARPAPQHEIEIVDEYQEKAMTRPIRLTSSSSRAQNAKR